LAYAKKIKKLDATSKAMYLDLNLYLADDILVKTDRASMACSLEVRTPFLDHDFVEFVLRLPLKYKLKGRSSKYLLKKAMKNSLPDDIINRLKKCFGVPVTKWISNGLKPIIIEAFSEDKIKKRRIVQSQYINKLLNDHLKMKKDNRKKYRHCLCFGYGNKII